MKKIMIFSIILMPLLALCILFLGGVIINRSTYLPVEQIEFAETSVVLNKPTDDDVSKTLQVNIFPILASNRTVEFWSGNEDIVTIDENGTITSQDFGETYVYVKSKENGARRASCKVLVTSDRVHKVWAENTISTIYVGETHNFNIKYAPIEANDVAFSVTSSDENIVSVSQNGVMTARNKGDVIITICLISNPNIKYSFEVKSKVKLQSISLLDSSPVVSGLKEFTYPQIIFNPSDASEKITYTSSNPNIATVNNEGKIIFLQAGAVTISAKAEDCDTEVAKNYRSTFGYFEDISFSNENVREINFEEYQNKELQLIWSGLPADADKTNISFASSNSEIIKVENNTLKVVGGGTAIIKIIAKTSENATKEATITILVKRKAERIDTQFSSLSYTTLKTLNLDFSAYPMDSTEKIEYILSDETLATIENNKLIFTQKTINNKNAKVKITVKTSSGVTKAITIIYLDSSLQQIELTNQSSLNFVMPKTNEGFLSFVLIANEENIFDVDLKIESGEENISQNGFIFTLTNKGSAQIGVYFNEQTTKSKVVEILITREVEEINDIKVIATWEDQPSDEFGETDIIYSSSNTFEFEYSLYPLNTTLTSATISIEGDGANIVNGKIEFNKACKVKLVISADNVSKKIEIESTNLHPDKNISVERNIDLEKGQNVSIFDYITLSPKNADKKYITYQTTDTNISIDSNGNILALSGGEANINVSILTNKEKISKQINVFVTETAENIKVLGDKYLFIETSTLNISNKFQVLPETANVGATLIYGVENDNVASVSQQGVLTFKKEGCCVVFAKLENMIVAKISVAFVKDSIILNNESHNFKVLKGTKVVILPSNEALATASYDELFVLDNNNSLVENKIFITINQDTIVEFNNEQYNIDCVEEIGNISLFPTNSEDVDIDSGKNITGLKQLQLTGEVSGISETYLNLTFSVVNEEIATITQTGLLTFKKAGNIEITYSATYKSDIAGSLNITKTATLVIESTFGSITKLVAKDSGIYTHNFDNDNILNNIVDIKSYLKVYPTQIVLTTENIKLNSSNNSIASVNNLNIEFCKGGEVEIEVQMKSSNTYVFGTDVKFEIKRNATAIYLDGRELVDGDVIEIHKSSMFIKPTTYPADANTNCEIAWEVISNNNVAEVDNNRITFKKVDEKIAIKFTLGKNENKKEFIVYFKTTIITFEVDVESETYVVPMKEPFTFVSTDELIDLQVEFSSEFTGIVDIESDVYTINESAVGTVTIFYNGQTKIVKFVSTTNLNEITNVKLSDINMFGALEEINTIQNELSLTTASTIVEVLYDIPTGYDKNGKQIEYSLSTKNNQVAEIIETNKIKFLTEGSAEITIAINFQDAYQERTITYSFTVKSTFGKVTQFSISKQDYNLIYDDLSDEQKIIDILSTVSRVAPIYGNVLEKTINSKNENVVSILNNEVVVCGSGNAIVEVTWGKVTKTINFVVDKFIDKINFVDNGEIISQIVTTSNTYTLNYIFTALDDNFKETLKDVTFTPTSNCSINNNVVTLNNENQKYEITIETVKGTASAKLIIIRVSEDTNIIKAKANLTDIIIEKDDVNIFDFRFNENIVNLSQIDENINIVNSEIQTFKGIKGSTGNLMFDNDQIVNYIVTEDVEDIKFKEDAVEDNYVTAMGEDGINLEEYYGAYVYPKTARNEQGTYEIKYSVSNAVSRNVEAIAYIENGLLYFTSQGKVTITFKAGDITKTRTIESTLGFAKSVSFKDNDMLIFEYTSKNYSLPEDFYSIYPSDAYKADVTFSSDNGNIFEVSNINTLTFVGGGKTNLTLTYSTEQDNTTTIKKEVYVKNRAKEIKFYDNGSQVGYIVKNNAINSTMSLDYEIIFDGNCLDYNIKLDSSNKDIATINEKGIITFKELGETTIYVKVQEKLNLENEETKDSFDTIGELKLIYRPNYNIIEVKDDVNVTFEYDDTKPCILYPILNKNVSEFNFEVETGTNVISINLYGEIEKSLGGEATIKVGEKGGDWSKQVDVYVHRKTQINISIPEIYKENTSPYDIYTSKVEFDISSIVTFSTTDAMVRKTVEYISSNQNVVIENETIKFSTAESTTITIKVLYNNDVETSASFTIYSSCNKVESFDISCNIEITDSAYVIYTNEEPIVFTTSNIKPKDYTGETSDLYFTSTNEDSYSITIANWKNFKVVPIKAGTGEFTVRYNGLDSTIYKNIKIIVKQLSTSIVIQHNNKTIESLKTFDSTINLTAIVGPTDATNKLVNWGMAVNSGSATYVVSEQDLNKVQIVFTDYGKVTLTAIAKDGASEISISIEYVKDIEGFTISTTQIDSSGTKTVAFNENDANQIAYLEWNQTNITFTINVLPSSYTGFNNFSNFSISTTNGRTATINGNGNFTIQTDSITDSPIYEDIITITYSAKYSGSITLKIYRDGLQKIDFGDHDKTKDEECGLQQLRVYGYKSYYDGVQDYYRMDVNIINNNTNVSLNTDSQPDFTNEVVWSSSDASVTIQTIGKGYVDINFANISTKNEFDDIYNYDSKTTDLTKGVVTIYASNKAGRVLCSYTFRIVNAVNIFDQAGYESAGANIVLQKSFGHDDQQTLIDSGKYVKLEAYVAKTTIYGNGHLMNFAYRNTFTSETTYKDYENIQVKINKAVNLRVQGSNYDSTYASYNIELTSVQKLAYCELYYMYRSVEISSGTLYVRKCLLRSFKSSGIIGSASDTKNLYFEDMIMFDVGQRAIELQKNSTAYVKGFLDVYNFQDQDALKKLGSIKIGSLEIGGSTLAKEVMSAAKKNGLTITGGDGDTYANVVGISTKSKEIQMLYYENGEYVYKEDGSQTQSAPNLKRISGSKWGVDYCAWAYKSYQDSNGNTIDGEYLTWEHEFYSDGSLNFEYMSGTTAKISRLGDTINLSSNA